MAIMGSAAIGVGEHYPHLAKVGNRWGLNISFTYTYYTHVTRSIYFTRLLNDVFHLLTDYFVAGMRGFVQREYCKPMANVN